MEIDEIYNLFKKNFKISTDSRNIKKGVLFFALKGENFDGNKYANEALKKGARYCIIDNIDYKINNKCILVDDVLKTLQKLANFHLKEIGIKTIAITGSNGKTTTKEIVTTVLSQKYKVKSTQGNFNNHIGVPLTVLSFTKDLDFGIVEMGANHKGEIKELADIVNPDYGIITNIGTAHIEGFGSYKGILETKLELYQNLGKNEGTAFIHSTNSELMLKSSEMNLNSVIFGTGKNTLVEAEIISNTPFITLKLLSDNKKKETEIKSNLIGDYNLENIMAGACIGAYFSVSEKQIKSAIESYVPKNMRSQFKETSKNKVILDAYNANPSSMKAAIQNLSSIDHKNKIVILGDMMELGEMAISEHQKIISLLGEKNYSKVFLVGQLFKNSKSMYTTFSNTDELIEYLKLNTLENNLILVKGSRKMKLEKIVTYL